MTRDEIEPMVPVMPDEDTTDQIRADGGVRRRYDAEEVAAPLVPDLR
jgi:enterochelin esterase-like enzyme